jgi:hypothetical protein
VEPFQGSCSRVCAIDIEPKVPERNVQLLSRFWDAFGAIAARDGAEQVRDDPLGVDVLNDRTRGAPGSAAT